MCSQNDDPTQYDRAPEPAPDDIGTDPEGREGARTLPGAVGREAKIPTFPDSPSNRGPFTAVDRSGAFIFLSKDQLRAMSTLFEDLHSIDRVFGTADTKSPEWRIHVQVMITQAQLMLA